MRNVYFVQIFERNYNHLDSIEYNFARVDDKNLVVVNMYRLLFQSFIMYIE